MGSKCLDKCVLNERVADPCQKPVARFGKHLTHTVMQVAVVLCPYLLTTEGSFSTHLQLHPKCPGCKPVHTQFALSLRPFGRHQDTMEGKKLVGPDTKSKPKQRASIS